MCEGGGCTFSSCENPTCGGGGCTYYNCEGGDAPKVVKVKKFKKNKTFGSMDTDQIEAEFGAKKGGAWEMGEGEEDSMKSPQVAAQHSDTGATNGFRIDSPDIRITNYDREKADTITTGQDGVLDASWTVGGRVQGREDIERMKQIKDLDAWAQDVKKKAELEVKQAREEREAANAGEAERSGAKRSELCEARSDAAWFWPL